MGVKHIIVRVVYEGTKTGAANQSFKVGCRTAPRKHVDKKTLTLLRSAGNSNNENGIFGQRWFVDA
jgi:hypothetical protein